MQNNECEEILTKQTRPGKKIRIGGKLIDNQKISVDVGTVDNKNCPKTIYLNISFWVDIKDRSGQEFDSDFDRNISKEFSKSLKSIYRNDLFSFLNNSWLFPFYYENIFSFDFPENLNYNDKKSFVNIELHLHTVNNMINSKSMAEYYSLRNDSKNEFFSELVQVANIIGNSDLLSERGNFLIYRKK